MSNISIPKHVTPSLLTEGEKRFATVNRATKGSLQITLNDGIRIEIDRPGHDYQVGDKLFFSDEGVVTSMERPVVQDVRPVNRSGSIKPPKNSYF